MSSTTITIGGQAVLDADQFLARLSHRPKWADKINQISCPPGSRPGGGAFLMSETAVNTLLGTTGQKDIVWTTDLGAHTLKSYVVKRAYEAIPTDGSPLVVEVEDARCFFNDSFSLDHYNIKDLGDPSYVSGTGEYTWPQVFDLLWFDVPSKSPYTLTVDLDLISGMPTIGSLSEYNPWLEMRRLAHMLHAEIQFDPVAGKVYVRNQKGFSVLDSTTLAALKPVQNLSPRRIVYGNVPEKVRVLFRSWPHWHPSTKRTPYSISVRTIDIRDKFTGFEQSMGAWTTGTDTVATVWSPLVAFGSALGSTSNSAQLIAAADHIATGVIADRLRAARPERLRYTDWIDPTDPELTHAEFIWSVKNGQTFTDVVVKPSHPIDRADPYPGDLENDGLLVGIPDGGLEALGASPTFPALDLYVIDHTGAIVSAQDTAGNAVKAPATHLGNAAIAYQGAGHKVHVKPMNGRYAIDVDYCAP